MLFTTKDVAETLALGAVLGKVAEPGDVYCLLGELGAGKTTLAQGIAKGLDVTQQVSSPTFTLIHEYPGRLPLYHMDLYRLNSGEAGEEIGLQEYLWGEGLCVIEWPQVAAELLPQDLLEVNILAQGDTRRITLVAHGNRSRQIIEEVTKRCGY